MVDDGVPEWLNALSVLPRFYLAVQDYDCRKESWDVIESLIADEMIYLTPNLKDRTPVSRDVFLANFREIHDVHSQPGRGSTYLLGHSVLTARGAGGYAVTSPIAMSHWAVGAEPESTWFYGRANAVVVGGGDTWRICELQLSIDRREGHEPPIDHLFSR